MLEGSQCPINVGPGIYKGPTSMQVYGGGSFAVTASDIQVDGIGLRSGSIGSMRYCSVKAVSIHSDASIAVVGNDFSSGHVYAIGDPAARINLENNCWGTTDPGEIENKITHHIDDPSRPWVDFEPFRPHTIGTNVIYLDFSSYTAPGGYGTAEEIASYVKQCILDLYSKESVIFTTSFQGSIEKPGLTSQVIFGGTDPDPNRLGSASTDPGNNNWTDIAYVYSDQALFTTMPSDANEYKSMLANTTAHEIGHLLGYDHSNAAGMPFMYDGAAMEAMVLQDILLGQLGEIAQSRYTYITNTDLDVLTAKPQLVYVTKESGPEQFQGMIAELDEQYDYNDVGVNWLEGERIVELVLNLAATFLGIPHQIAISMPPIGEDIYCRKYGTTGTLIVKVVISR